MTLLSVTFSTLNGVVEAVCTTSLVVKSILSATDLRRITSTELLNSASPGVSDTVK